MEITSEQIYDKTVLGFLVTSNYRPSYYMKLMPLNIDVKDTFMVGVQLTEGSYRWVKMTIGEINDELEKLKVAGNKMFLIPGIGVEEFE